MPVARVLAAASMGPQLLLPYYSPLLKSALRIHYSLLSVSRDFSFSSHVSNCWFSQLPSPFTHLCCSQHYSQITFHFLFWSLDICQCFSCFPCIFNSCIFSRSFVVPITTIGHFYLLHQPQKLEAGYSERIHMTSGGGVKFKLKWGGV